MLGSSNPGQLRLRHWLSADALATRLDLIHILGYISSTSSARSHPHSRLHLIHILGYISSTFSATSHPYSRLHLIHLGYISSTTRLHTTVLTKQNSEQQAIGIVSVLGQIHKKSTFVEESSSKPVLRIRDVYPGTEFFPSRILDPHQEFKYFNPKNCF